MPYTKPGVEVTYVQQSVSPNLNTPALPATIVGKSYKIHDIAPNSVYQDSYPETYDNTNGSTVTISGEVLVANIDNASVYVDLVNGTGRKHLTLTDDFTVSTGIITLEASLAAAFHGASIQVGYRELITSHNNLVMYESPQDVEARVGKIDIYNPLTWGLSWAISNAATAVGGYGINNASETTGHTNAIADLALEEDVYAIAPMTKDSSIHGLYQTHVDAMSTPANKKERILIAGRQMNWKLASGSAATGSNDANLDPGQTVSDIADGAQSNGNRRVFWVYPETLYVRQLMHISQVKITYMNAMWGGAYGTTNGEHAKIANTITLPSTGKKVFAGTLLSLTVVALIQTEMELGNLNYMIDAFIPVPGFLAAACVAGQRAGVRPEQPLTNVPLAGPAQVKYSGDFFSEARLNTAAGGGTYWLFQRNLNAPIVARHQLSTDVSSVQRQEMSITSALDFTGKFLRDGVAFYIGRYTITPAFLKMLQMVVSAQGTFLVREGYLNSFSISSMVVSSTSADTIECTVEIGVKFPVNKISFTLIF